METNDVIIRFDEVAKQTSNHITRFVGFIPGKHILPLFKSHILDANPRKPKAGRVTTDIISTLDETPELFQFKSKGILIGTSKYQELQRNRIKLSFDRPSTEGILDGGHNMLSIGLHILESYIDDKLLRKLKTWDQLIEYWDEFSTDIKNDRDYLDFHLAAELIVPASQNPTNVEDFRIASIDICAARNNNAQLAQEAKANQKGFYDEIRNKLNIKHPELSNRVEWKTNEWENGDEKPVKVRDLIALAWIPLMVLDDENLLPEKFKLSPQLLYSSKAKLSEQFDDLLQNEKVAKLTKTGKYELHSTTVGSALDILCDMPGLVDWIIKSLPCSYNKIGGKFGGIAAVKIPKRGKVLTPYFQHEMGYRVPDGFVMPLVYGLRALMTVVNNKVVWAIDPLSFLEAHFDEIVKGYKMPMGFADFDPQKVGKNVGSYDFCVKQFKFAKQSI